MRLHSTTRKAVAAFAATALATAGLAALGSSAQAATGGTLAYGLTTDNKIISFRVGSASTVASEVAVTGLQAGEDLVGIDIRPATGALYAVGTSNRVYVIDPTTGAATNGQSLSSASAPLALSGTVYGVDFNPVPDRLRIVSDAEQNLRVNVDTGVTVVDGSLAYATTDAGAGSNPAVAAAGYTNSVAGTTTTALYDIDTARDVLVKQDPPNNGTLVTVGPLGVDVSAVAGLDIEPATGVAYATLQTASGTSLYTINLTTGAATAASAVRSTVEDVAVATPRFAVVPSAVAEGATATVTVRRTGDTADAATVDYATSSAGATEGTDFTRATGTLSFAAGETTRTFTVPTALDGATEGAEAFLVTLTNPTSGAVLSPASGSITITDAEAGKAFGLTTSNQLVAFSVSSPGTIASTLQITGLQTGEDLVGFDVRPADGTLVAVGSSNRLYTINPDTGAAAEKSVLSTPLSGSSFGVDWNPAVDRLRIVSNTGQNLRVNADTGAVTVDGSLAYAAGDTNAGKTPAVAGAGYTNNTASATPTVLLDIDTTTDALVRQSPPNDGVLNTVGALGLALSANAVVGLDVSSQGGAAFAVLTPDTVPASSSTVPVSLYRIDTTTGAARLLGALGNTAVEDIALSSVTATPTQSPTPTATASPSTSATMSPSPVCTTTSGNLAVTINTPTINATGLASVTVSGARAGSTVELQGYSQNHFGTANFANDTTPVDRTAVADGNGTATFNDLRPASNTRVRAKERGCAFADGALGAVINVRATETLQVTRSGSLKYVVTGSSIPARPGGLIVSLYRINGQACAAGVEPRNCPGEVFIGQGRADQTTGKYRIDLTFPASDANSRVKLVVKTGQDAQNAPGRSNVRDLAVF